MKKRIQLFTVLAVLTAFIFAISCQSRVKKEDATGTIGKVKKYRKDQMSENEIKLRSEIIEDTARLADVIRGLTAFNAFSMTFAESVNRQLDSLEACDCYNMQDENIVALKDFIVFIENNNKVLDNTIFMLVDFYNDEVSEVSFDVESNFKNFVNYVNQFDQRDTVIDNVLNGMDDHIAANIDIEEGKEEIEQLKNIRDILLFRDIQGAFFVGDHEKLGILAQSSLFNVESLNGILAPAAIEELNIAAARENLNIAADRENLNIILSSDQLSGIILWSDVSFINNISDLGNREKLGFFLAPLGLLAGEESLQSSELGGFVLGNTEEIKSAIMAASLFNAELNSKESLGILLAGPEL